MADDPRPRGGGGEEHREDRGGGAKVGPGARPVDESQALELTPEERYGYVMFLGLVFRTYPRRAILGATLMITQSFLYNAIYFTYGLVLVQFYGVLGRQGASVRAGIRGRQSVRAADPRAALRQRGPETDDLAAPTSSPASCLRSAAGCSTRATSTRRRRRSAGSSSSSSPRRGRAPPTSPSARRGRSRSVPRRSRSSSRSRRSSEHSAPSSTAWLIGDGSDPTGLFIGYVIGGAIMVIGGLSRSRDRDQGRGQIARRRHETDHLLAGGPSGRRADTRAGGVVPKTQGG